jgi:hypothetical protein
MSIALYPYGVTTYTIKIMTDPSLQSSIFVNAYLFEAIAHEKNLFPLD